MWIYSPLEQFTVIPLFALEGAGGNITFSNSSLALLLVTFIAISFFGFSLTSRTLVAGRWQSFVEIIYNFIIDMIKGNVGKKGEPFFPILFTIFIFVLFSNVLGLIPYSFTPTAQLLVTSILAFSIWFLITVTGLIYHRIKFFSLFFPEGTPIAMAPFLVIIEIVSYLTRPFSLSIRLFANMLTGHLLCFLMAQFSWQMMSVGGAIYVAGYLPILFLTGLIGFELAICAIQAYIFTVLPVIYFNDSINLH